MDIIDVNIDIINIDININLSSKLSKLSYSLLPVYTS